jgi:cyclopropane fatty-acyl-phospholipid synthase-like methyltransferase
MARPAAAASSIVSAGTAPVAEARGAYAARRQEEIYAKASGPIWREAVYNRLHAGWELANLGGLPFLDAVARLARLDERSNVLELGSGSGAACEYLVRTTGCRATGVERNDAQHNLAAARTATPGFGDRIRFVRADLVDWSADEAYDAAYMLDTLSLLPDAAAALRNAAAALSGAGVLFIADLGIGRETDPAVLERAFVEDGFSSLLTAEAMIDLLHGAGFETIRLDDRGEHACRNLQSIMSWLDDPPQDARGAVPAEELDDWRRVNRFYLDALKAGALSYRWWSAEPLTPRMPA